MALSPEQFACNSEHFMVMGKVPHPVRAGSTIDSTHGPFHTKQEAVGAIADNGLSKAKISYYPPGTLTHG